jgi:hypothetical protein
MLENVRMIGNTFGLKADASVAGTSVFVTVRDSVSSGNTFSGFTAITLGGGTAAITADRVASATNGTTGFRSDGAGAFIGVSQSTVSGNGIAFQFSNSGQLFTFCNNMEYGNSTNGAVSGTLSPSWHA